MTVEYSSEEQTTPTERTDETTPLLPEQVPESGGVLDDDDRPLPLFQIFLLCYARLAEPVAFFSIVPFVNQFINEVGAVPESDVGFWSGWIESIFSLTQMIFMLFWGRASDKYGRKPVLVLSLAGVAVASVLFGISQTVWQMIALRSVAGIFAGTVVTVRTMLTENSTQKTQARAFSFFAFAGNIGIFLGPLIGGGLSKPTELYPWIFGSNYLFTKYPYLLPCIVSGGVAGSACIINLLWLHETRPLRQGDHALVIKPPPVREVLAAEGVVPVLVIFEYALLLGVAYTAVVPVFFYTPVALGGFGFSFVEISVYLASAGCCQAVWLLLVFPPLVNRIGTGTLLRVCAVAWPVAFAVMPLLNVFLRAGWWTAFWVVAPVMVIGSSGVSMAFTCVQLALNDVSPSHLSMGTLNGIALSLQSAVRAVGPALYTSIYAVGVRNQILAGHLGWLVLVLTAVGFVLCLRWYPEKAEGRPKPKMEAANETSATGA